MQSVAVYVLSFVVILALLVPFQSVWGRAASPRRRRYFRIGLAVTAVLFVVNVVLGPNVILLVLVYVSAGLATIGSSMLAGYQDDRDEELAAR